MIKVVRGRIVGGTGPNVLIAVDAEFGRVYGILERRLSPMMPLQSFLAHNPETFTEPFDGTQEDEDAILGAAHDPDVVDPQPETSWSLPAVDLVQREQR